MISREFDVVVIGGGPGGSTAATFLAKSGHTVLVLEKEHFPRFHIGESLLPYNRRLFEEMGVLPILEAAGFPRKYGAQFHLGNGTKALNLVFRNGKFTEEPMAFQVERAVFDDLLLKHARSSGAQVMEGWTCQGTRLSGDKVEVDARSEDGTRTTFTAKFAIDASGRANLTGTQEGLRQTHPGLKKMALFGHYSGVLLDSDQKGGDTIIVRLSNKWFWIIPISTEKSSVGLVMDHQEFAAATIAPEELFNQALGDSPPMRERMANARRIGDFRTTTDFSYFNRRLVGPRLLRVGDAAGFMDPIFSAGVFLAMFSGKLAAETVCACLRSRLGHRYHLSRYERKTFAALRFYWEMVEQFYTKPFMELFLQPREKVSIPAAVNAALAGELTGRWAVRWRMRVFFWLVKLQARLPIVPHFRVE